MAQKLSCVMSVTWCIVLLEDKHVFSNTTNHWQQFLHGQQFLTMLPVDFSPGSMKMRVGIIELRYHNGTYGLAESGYMHRRWLTLMSHCLVATCAYNR